VSCLTWSRSSYCNAICCVCWDPMNIEYYVKLTIDLSCLCYLWPCMLSVASRCLWLQEGVFMLDSGFMPLLIWESDNNFYGCRCAVATREKTTIFCSRIIVLFILHTLLNAIIYCLQLNTQRLFGWYPEGGLLVIYAVGLRSMYYVVMPKWIS
jgi:hypothetical protein